MAALSPGALSCRSLLLAGAGGLVASPASAGFSAAVGLIDLELSRSALRGQGHVRLRTMTLWGTDQVSATKQSPKHRRRHGDVMATELASAFAQVAPDKVLSLFVASPIQQDGETQAIDLDQLRFAYDWMAAQGVRIVVQTFVGRDTANFRQAYDHALKHGLILVASAGNGPDENPVPAYPAAYGGAISISTTALNDAFAREDVVLASTAGIASRRSYVDFAVAAPPISPQRASRDPDAVALQGSSRAAAVAGGALAALATRENISSVGDARALLADYAASGSVAWAAHGVLDVDRIADMAAMRPRTGSA